MTRIFAVFLAACLLFTAAGCSGEGSRPFEDLKPEDVKQLRIEYLPGKWGYTYVDLDGEQTARMVDLLSEITLLDPHDEVYYGPWWRIVITKKDGTRTTVDGAGNPSITIDGKNYYWKYEGVIEKLDAFCLELKPEE